MEGGGTGEEDMDSFRGASLTRCLAMEEGGGFEVGSGREVDKGVCGMACSEMEPWSSPDRSLFLSFSSFSDSSDFFQRGPKARLSLFGPVL
jgi:hypothetical protein